MKKKIAVTAVLLALAAFSAFADVGMYVKGTLGYDQATAFTRFDRQEPKAPRTDSF